MKLTGGCATYVGNTRKVNQDAILYRSSEKDGCYFTVLAVCDGIGGLEKGELASALVVRQANAWYERILQWLDIPTADPDVLYAHVKDAAEEWNRKVCEYRERNRIQTGTTLSLLLLLRDKYYTLQVGDIIIWAKRGICGLPRPAERCGTEICFWCVPTVCIIICSRKISGRSAAGSAMKKG